MNVPGQLVAVIQQMLIAGTGTISSTMKNELLYLFMSGIHPWALLMLFLSAVKSVIIPAVGRVQSQYRRRWTRCQAHVV
jgi:hypothetical protein